MLTIENDQLRAQLDPCGAALASLVFKPLGREMCYPVSADTRAKPQGYFGSIVGPVANRIAAARFEMNERSYELDHNEGRNCLHGGSEGTSEQLWHCRSQSETTVEMTVEWPDQLGGFAGPMTLSAAYRLDGSTLCLMLTGRSARDFAINLAPHFYFSADLDCTVNDLQMKINARHYLPVDEEKIPTGKTAFVSDGGFDFLKWDKIGVRPIDHNFCLDAPDALQLRGKNWQMDIVTNQLGLQIYTGDHLERRAMAIEPQGWPNALNQPNFPTQILSAGSTYENRSSFTFQVLGESD